MPENNSDNQKQGGLSGSTPAQNPRPAQKPAAAPKAQEPSKPASNSTKYIIMIVLGVIAGVVIAWGWSALRSPQEATSTADTNLGTDTATAPILSLGLTISSPQIAGNSVAVAKAVVSAPTWIVVYENNAGQPGNALGAALFFPENQGGTVELL